MMFSDRVSKFESALVGQNGRFRVIAVNCQVVVASKLYFLFNVVDMFSLSLLFTCRYIVLENCTSLRSRSRIGVQNFVLLLLGPKVNLTKDSPVSDSPLDFPA